MTCRQVETLVDEVAAGLAPDKVDVAVRVHTARCPSCDRALRKAEALRELIARANEPLTPSADFTRRVRQQIDDQNVRPRALDRALSWVTTPVIGGVVLAAAACLALALMLPGKLHRGEAMRVASAPPPERPPLMRLLDMTAVDRSAMRNDERDLFSDAAVGDIAKAEATRYLKELDL